MVHEDLDTRSTCWVDVKTERAFQVAAFEAHRLHLLNGSWLGTAGYTCPTMPLDSVSVLVVKARSVEINFICSLNILASWLSSFPRRLGNPPIPQQDERKLVEAWKINIRCGNHSSFHRDDSHQNPEPLQSTTVLMQLSRA